MARVRRSSDSAALGFLWSSFCIRFRCRTEQIKIGDGVMAFENCFKAKLQIPTLPTHVTILRVNSYFVWLLYDSIYGAVYNSGNTFVTGLQSQRSPISNHPIVIATGSTSGHSSDWQRSLVYDVVIWIISDLVTGYSKPTQVRLIVSRSCELITSYSSWRVRLFDLQYGYSHWAEFDNHEGS